MVSWSGLLVARPATSLEARYLPVDWKVKLIPFWDSLVCLITNENILEIVFTRYQGRKKIKNMESKIIIKSVCKRNS